MRYEVYRTTDWNGRKRNCMIMSGLNINDAHAFLSRKVHNVNTYYNACHIFHQTVFEIREERGK